MIFEPFVIPHTLKSMHLQYIVQLWCKVTGLPPGLGPFWVELACFDCARMAFLAFPLIDQTCMLS